MMKKGGLGFLVPSVNIAGVRDLASDDPTTTAITRPGIADIGGVTSLDDDFFDKNHGNDRLETIIHESMHVYYGVRQTQEGSSDDAETVHGRVALWAGKFNSAIRSGQKARVPLNLNDVLQRGDAPEYIGGWKHKSRGGCPK